MFGGRIAFDSAIRLAGGKLVVVHTHDELAAAINGKTAMVYTTALGERLEKALAIAKKAGRTLLVDGEEALARVTSQPFDAGVSDLKMPELDGPSLYSEVTRRWPNQPPHVLFLSALGSPSEYDGFLKVIHARVLPKPFTIAALRRAIKRML